MNDVPIEAGPLRVLFVCTGNTCRSPMAEVIARRGVRDRGWEHVEVGSAGVAAFDGAPASGGAIFDNHFVVAPWSLPSQVSFLTGKHTCGHGCSEIEYV